MAVEPHPAIPAAVGCIEQRDFEAIIQGPLDEKKTEIYTRNTPPKTRAKCVLVPIYCETPTV